MSVEAPDCFSTLLFTVLRRPNTHVQPCRRVASSLINPRLLHEKCHVNEAVTLEKGRWNAALCRFSWSPSTRNEYCSWVGTELMETPPFFLWFLSTNLYYFLIKQVIDKPITSCLVDCLACKKGLLSFDNDIVNMY
ncbi:hypothetical protein NC651_025563 [Populus alba x Populus x berolinensis]|nr:hypothetical protein NC651_025563 [Populus alba x Populus x berolinensis]